MKTGRRIFVVRFEPEPGVDPIPFLRWLIKQSGTLFAVRVVGVGAEDADERETDERPTPPATPIH